MTQFLPPPPSTLVATNPIMERENLRARSTHFFVYDPTARLSLDLISARRRKPSNHGRRSRQRNHLVQRLDDPIAIYDAEVHNIGRFREAQGAPVELLLHGTANID